ncbi:MAG TPA: ATP-dependent DNA helicase RecG [Candidatus Udaeobacter sp.]|nr:ATP-dependent DNA helicase RecG [Candidatus Udaeobacter sp.]
MQVTDRHAATGSRPQTAKALFVTESLKILQTTLRFLKGIGPKRAAQLESIGLITIEDLLYHLPFRYEDRRQIKKIRAAVPGGHESFVGTLIRLQKKYLTRRRSQLLAAQLADETGVINLVWYRAPTYLTGGLLKGSRLLVHGKVEPGRGGLYQIVHPEFEVLESDDHQDLQKILPVYLRPGGLSLSLMRKWIGHALSEFAPLAPSHLPAAIIQRQAVFSLTEALLQLHQPDVKSDVTKLNNGSSVAHRSLLFDELFYLQLGLGLRKKSYSASKGILLTRQQKDLISAMSGLLPFKLTRAQSCVLGEIYKDLESSRAMQRLVQGDVGSGKTMVAWFASLRVIENGYQAVWIAPTELLAEQHYRNLRQFSDALGLNSILITAAQPNKERKSVLEKIARDEIQFVVGTHALIQDGVYIPQMGLGVIDEQHRFGVMQRLSLQRLTTRGTGSPATRQPHMLLMSATPIPRSLALVLYGDMDVSFLNEMPPGRLPVKTKVYREHERKAVYRLVLEELRKGYQAFVVYPLVEASEQLQQVRDATQMAEKMRQSVFKDFGVALVHGRMAAAERDEVMRRFRDKEAGVLVATTVIEVGIDIPNATVIVVEHAERFGLSQLHQLRGRVGRGKALGYCLLVNRAHNNAAAAKRLRVMEQEHDGFKIAEADLSLRGPGEFLGTRQSGLGDFRLVNLARDARLLIEARKEAQVWLEHDPELKSRESVVMRQMLLHRWGQRLELGAVG